MRNAIGLIDCSTQRPPIEAHLVRSGSSRDEIRHVGESVRKFFVILLKVRMHLEIQPTIRAADLERLIDQPNRCAYGHCVIDPLDVLRV